MACEFSADGKYFAQISLEGKLKIWNTLSNSFEQEFTPNFHLASPCTCLHFIHSDTTSKLGSPRKKKRKNFQNGSSIYIALGTASGRLLIYSLTKGDLDHMIDSMTSQSINCLSTNNDEYIYSGIDSSIFVWNLHKRNINSKWVAGNEKINGILVIPDSQKLLTASKNIKLWDIHSKEVLKVYTGHSSQVNLLHYIKPKDSAADAYVMSGSKGDRLLNCWNLNENVDGKNAVASFLMEDIVNNLSIYISNDGSTHMAATVRSGVVHVYQHTLNGKCSKPLKPKTTIQVVSDSREDVISPIHITAAVYRDTQTLCIGYGSAVVQTFENITISNYQKLQCLLREDLHKLRISKENQVSKVHTPIVGNDVHYLTSQTSSVTTKRKNDGQQEVPMERRLENLMANELDSNSKVPKADNIAQLLVQGLHSKDKNILKTVLLKKDELLIKNTIRRLPITVIVPLFEELTKLIQGKTLSRKIGLMWLKNILLIHSGLLLSNPDLPKLFGEALGSIEAGIALQTPRSKLMGRLELLVSQISQVSAQEPQNNNEALLIFNDKVSSDSDNDVMEFEVHSNSENDWEEASSSDGENNENEKVDGSDNENEGDSDEPMFS
ncbi:WD repeat-containing protein 43 [Asbolus verrucosus]|uniref:WD repeat-containing protein 43 n=1 Tax=Asbolus verrucosus TaxID=1661398 RepID=A0A482V9X3_ASBVE|nr:WD repeat-containing protein 43 [Asbolus verrucosus]